MNGVLIFKWNEDQVSIIEIMKAIEKNNYSETDYQECAGLFL